ncbi:MAG: hypothetical protein WC755_09285, partial [Candidatus Woesearchaeota archaeon]
YFPVKKFKNEKDAFWFMYEVKKCLPKEFEPVYSARMTHDSYPYIWKNCFWFHDYYFYIFMDEKFTVFSKFIELSPEEKEKFKDFIPENDFESQSYYSYND